MAILKRDLQAVKRDIKALERKMEKLLFLLVPSQKTRK